MRNQGKLIIKRLCVEAENLEEKQNVRKCTEPACQAVSSLEAPTAKFLEFLKSTHTKNDIFNMISVDCN